MRLQSFCGMALHLRCATDARAGSAPARFQASDRIVTHCVRERAQVVAAGRRRHFYIYDLAGGHVSRVTNIAGVSDKSLETFAVSPSSQVHRTANFRAMFIRLHCRGFLAVV